MYKVTLGIPIYNGRNLLERSLLSALNQTYPYIEYLFIDDKGDSMDIVHRIVAEHERAESVRIIDQGYNRGTGAARNAIIENATGDYLFTMDCDDVITTDCIEILCNKMQEHPVDFVAASFLRRDLAGTITPGCSYPDIIIEGGENPVAEYRYGQGKEIFVAIWNKLYKVDFLRQNHVQCISYHLNEDPWFTYQVMMYARSCQLISVCTLYYTINPVSITGLIATEGYSERTARQYVEIEKLKAELVSLYAAKSFYIGALVDIIWMGTYFAYRVLASKQLAKDIKREFATSLLRRKFVFPEKYSINRMFIKYLMLYVFWGLPVCLKYHLLFFAVWATVKNRIRRWVHF